MQDLTFNIYHLRKLISQIAKHRTSFTYAELYSANEYLFNHTALPDALQASELGDILEYLRDLMDLEYIDDVVGLAAYFNEEKESMRDFIVFMDHESTGCPDSVHAEKPVLLTTRLQVRVVRTDITGLFLGYHEHAAETRICSNVSVFFPLNTEAH